MEINLEAAQTYSIQAYNDQFIQINAQCYEKSLIVSRIEIISDVTIKKIEDIDLPYLELLLQTEPEIIIFGHSQQGKFLSFEIIKLLTEKRIGVECMSIPASCRTFNILLNENRAVVLALIR